jgi:hypothetical protein
MHHVVTMVVRPTKKSNLPTMQQFALKLKSRSGENCEVLISIQDRWGIIAAYGSNPYESVTSLNSLILELRINGFIM